MESIWMENCSAAARPSLYGNTETEIAVVGGGMAGVLIALLLHERGKRVVILEADRIGSGQTACTTAKVTAQHGAIYADLIENFGWEKARMYADINQRAIGHYRRIADQYGIDCDLEETDAILYSYAHEEAMHREAEAAAALGLPATFTTHVDLPIKVCGAVRFTDQAQLHPLKLLHPLADLLTVYERTPVEKIDGHDLITPKGTVRAEKIIFATHYPLLNKKGLYFARLHQERSYAIALENAPLPRGMYYGYESYALSMRTYGRYLILGGGTHRTGENPRGGKYQALREAARILFPQAREVAHWSAQDCMSASGVPYIGRFSEKMPYCYVATGFRKWGMTSAMVAAEILSGLICDGSHPQAAIFDPGDLRQQKPREVLSEGAHAIRGLSRRVIHGVLPLPQEIPVGHGAVAEVDGKQMGVYRVSAEEYYAVELACPHLGCRLEWNPDEKSWDCPCHGSRFDYRGKRIAVPAQTHLGTCAFRRSSEQPRQS